MQGSGRALLIAISAWISVCLLIAGWVDNPSPEVHFVWMLSGMLGLVSSVGLAEAMKTDVKVQRNLIAGYIEAALTDGLTGIANRQALDTFLKDTFANETFHKNKLCLIMVDIDHFKSINDQWGHQAGDAVLRCLSQKAKEFFRGKGCVARYGGEEFAIALPNTKLKQAFASAEEFRGLVKTGYCQCGVQDLEITISAGVAEVRSNDTPESLIRRADLALYTAKKMGRNCIWLADSATQLIDSNEMIELGI